MPEKSRAAKILVPAMLADTDYLFRQAKDGSEAFLSAQPFPHLLLSSLIKPACCNALFEGLQADALAATPAKTGKSFYPQLELSPVVRMLLWELSSSTLIRHFASLAGTPPLLPDPFLIHSGVSAWTDVLQTHVAEQEFFLRHPETHLQNVLRMEMFVSNESGATFIIDLVDKQGYVKSTQIASSGSVLFTGSDNYHLHYHRDVNSPHKSARWCSLTAFYYINDRARNLNGQEQPRASY